MGGNQAQRSKSKARKLHLGLIIKMAVLKAIFFWNGKRRSRTSSFNVVGTTAGTLDKKQNGGRHGRSTQNYVEYYLLKQQKKNI